MSDGAGHRFTLLDRRVAKLRGRGQPVGPFAVLHTGGSNRCAADPATALLPAVLFALRPALRPLEAENKPFISPHRELDQSLARKQPGTNRWRGTCLQPALVTVVCHRQTGLTVCIVA